MKFVLIIMFNFIIVIPSAQNYNFTHGSINNGGGYQINSLYSNNTTLSEYVVGESSTLEYYGYLSFLFPIMDGYPPIISSIDDVPNDQGRKVQVVWNKCGFDNEFGLDSYYSVWRLDEDFEGMNIGNPATTMRIDDSSLVSDSWQLSNGVSNFPNRANERKNRKSSIRHSTITSILDKHSSLRNIFIDPGKVIEQFRKNPNKTYYWQQDRDVWTFIDEIPALQYNEYSYIAPTLTDSNSIEINYSSFKVVYHDLYEYYESIPVSGYSTDDIPPDETRTYITKVDNFIRISWDEITTGTNNGNSYEELNGIWYNIYTGDSPDFVCNEITYKETVTNLHNDYPLIGEEIKFYKIKVSDQP